VIKAAALPGDALVAPEASAPNRLVELATVVIKAAALPGDALVAPEANAPDRLAELATVVIKAAVLPDDRVLVAPETNAPDRLVELATAVIKDAALPEDRAPRALQARQEAVLQCLSQLEARAAALDALEPRAAPVPAAPAPAAPAPAAPRKSKRAKKKQSDEWPQVADAPADDIKPQSFQRTASTHVLLIKPRNHAQNQRIKLYFSRLCWLFTRKEHKFAAFDQALALVHAQAAEAPALAGARLFALLQQRQALAPKVSPQDLLDLLRSGRFVILPTEVEPSDAACASLQRLMALTPEQTTGALAMLRAQRVVKLATQQGLDRLGSAPLEMLPRCFTAYSEHHPNVPEGRSALELEVELIKHAIQCDSTLQYLRPGFYRDANSIFAEVYFTHAKLREVLQKHGVPVDQ
jgi:hypothetical protein